MENESAGSEAPESQRLPSNPRGPDGSVHRRMTTSCRTVRSMYIPGMSSPVSAKRSFAWPGMRFTRFTGENSPVRIFRSIFPQGVYKGEIEAETFDAGVLNQTELANLKLLAQMEEEKKGGQVRAPAISIQDFPEIDGSTATLPLSHACTACVPGQGPRRQRRRYLTGRPALPGCAFLTG